MTVLKESNVNGVDLEILGKTLEAVKADGELGRSVFAVRNRWKGGTHNCSMISDFYGAKQQHPHKRTFELNADEPTLLAGSDEDPNPVEFLLHALASCLTTSLVAHAAVRGIHLEEVESEVDGDLDLRGFFGISRDIPKGYSRIRAKYKIKATGTDAQQLRTLAEFSPVYNTLRKSCPIDLDIQVRA